MGSYYLVKKHIKKNYYWYYQTTWREGSKVKCHCIYVGPVSKIARPLARRGLASKPKASTNDSMQNEDSIYIRTAKAAGWTLDPVINKWRHSQSSALYVNNPRWGRYACEDHNIAVPGVATKPKASMNAGMHNQYPGDPAAEGRAAVMRDDFNRKAAAELATLSGFHEDRWFEYASVHGVNLNEYLERAITFKGKERNDYLNKLVDVVTGYSTDTFPPFASTASAKTSMNGGMNNDQKYTRMFFIAKQCKTYVDFCERLYGDGLFSAKAPEQITAFVRERELSPIFGDGLMGQAAANLA